MDKLFRKSLTESDGGSRLSVPTQCLTKWPCLGAGQTGGQTSVDLLVKDRNSMVWKFCITIRKNGYRKPVLSGQWKSFAMSNGLSVGDEIKLFKENNQALHYRVEVKKAVIFTLFGTSFIALEQPRVL